MLSLSRVTTQQAINYYTKDNYYDEKKGISSSSWSGKLSKSMSLSGHVKNETFKSLLEGKCPKSGVSFINRSNTNSDHNMRSAIDLTFSAPKTVTLTALFDQRVVDAHNKSVDKSLEFVEKQYSHVRRGKYRSLDITKNLLFAKFLHDTSRQVTSHKHPDPQLHTHALCFNFTKAQDGKHMSIHNDAIFSDSKLIGMYYQNELAKEIMKLGYNIELNNNGTFDIGGYSREQINQFSKRRLLINKKKHESKKDERLFVLKSRKTKSNSFGRNELKSLWLKEAKNCGIKFIKPRSRGVLQAFESYQSLIQSGINHVSERESLFSKKKVIESILTNNLGSIEAVESLDEKVSTHHQLIPNYMSKMNILHYTTLELQRKERSILDIAESGINKFDSILTDSGARRVVEGENFTDEQKQALSSTLTIKDQFVGWQGVAGSGKTFALKLLAKEVTKRGQKCLGMAPDAESAKSLKMGAQLKESMTIDRFLYSNQKNIKNSVWIVDESGKIPISNFHKLITRAKELNSRIIFTGDINQLAGIGAGQPFKTLMDSKMKFQYLSTHRRQSNVEIKEILDNHVKSNFNESFRKLKKYCNEYQKESTLIDKTVNHYSRLTPKEREKTLFVTPNNSYRTKIVNQIRTDLIKSNVITNVIGYTRYVQKNKTQEDLKHNHHIDAKDLIFYNKKNGTSGFGLISKVKRGTIKIKSVLDTKTLTNDINQIQIQSLYTPKKINVGIGDRIRWSKNEKKQNRYNGQEFVVTKTSKNHMKIKCLETNKTHLINTRKPMFFEHSIVQTVYSSQGKTFENVVCLTGDKLTKKELYVVVSRSKNNVTLYCKSLDDIKQTLQKSMTNDIEIQSKSQEYTL